MVLVSKPLKQLSKIESQLGRLDFLVPDLVECELERLAENAGPKRSGIARTALEIARSKLRIVTLTPAKYVDDSIVEYAMEQRCAVATIDLNLRRRLIANEVLVLSLSKDNLIVANPNLKKRRIIFK
jgi:rRNA-processing protein FCF1